METRGRLRAEIDGGEELQRGRAGRADLAGSAQLLLGGVDVLLVGDGRGAGDEEREDEEGEREKSKSHAGEVAPAAEATTGRKLLGPLSATSPTDDDDRSLAEIDVHAVPAGGDARLGEAEESHRVDRREVDAAVAAREAEAIVPVRGV
jgi:hypothetical protein